MELVDSAAFAGSPKAFFARIASSGQPALSYSEEFLWWGARLAGDTTFNVRVVLRLRGPLHVAALEASVVEIARRHETLRTVFPMEHGVILRRLLPPDTARPAFTDLEHVDAADRQAEAWRLVLEESNRPFNLSRGPLFRARILRVNGDDHLLQFTIHHLVVDGRSVDILLRELSVLYGAFSRDQASPLPDLPIQYAEHAAHRKRLFQSGTLNKALSYWKTQLAGIPSLLDLPTDRLRRTARHYRGQTMTFEFSPDRTKALTQLARRHNTTLFVVLLAMLKILLHRLSGHPSIVIEAPLGNRRSLEAEGLIGLCVDLVMLRTDLSGDLRLSDLVSSVRRTTLGAFDHAGVPIHVLVGALDATVDESHSALSQVMFNLIDRRQRAVHLESLNAEQMPLPDSPHSKFDMMLTAHLTDRLRFQLVYKRDLFSEPRMRELVEQFKTVADQVLADPDKRVGQYSLVTPGAERVLPRATGRNRSGAGLQPCETPFRGAKALRHGRLQATRSHYETVSEAARWTCETFGIPPGSRVGVLSSANPDVVMQAILTALWCRGSVCFPPADGAAAHDLHGWLADREIVVAWGEPTTWRRLKKSGGALPALRYAFFIGGVLVREDVARVRAFAPDAACGYFFACETGSGFTSPLAAADLGRPLGDALRSRSGQASSAQTPRGLDTISGPHDRPQISACYRVPSSIDALRTIVPIGRALPGVELVVLNTELQLAGVGELGELYVSRAGELIATGAAGRFLPDGDIDRIGNRSDCDTMDGYTIRFDEVASVLMEHPAVLDARVALDKRGNQPALVARVTIDDEQAWSGDAFGDFARHRLAGYMVPVRVELASQL